MVLEWENVKAITIKKVTILSFKNGANILKHFLKDLEVIFSIFIISKNEIQ